MAQNVMLLRKTNLSTKKFNNLYKLGYNDFNFSLKGVEWFIYFMYGPQKDVLSQNIMIEESVSFQNHQTRLQTNPLWGTATLCTLYNGTCKRTMTLL